MSLILEALKKSEAQRRLGEMPNLGTPIASTRRTRASTPWLAIAIALLIAAGLGWYSLRVRQQPAGSASISAPAPTAPIKVMPNAQDLPRNAPISTHSAEKPAAPARTPNVPPASAASAPKEVPRPAPAPSAPATATIAPPATSARDSANPPVAPPLPIAQTAAQPVAPPAVAPAPAADDVPTLDELPANVRSALPALPITMQVYSTDPKHRFVIIDGTRVVEGDSLHGVTVQEIRPSGLVLEFQGRRVLLPRPGS